MLVVQLQSQQVHLRPMPVVLLLSPVVLRQRPRAQVVRSHWLLVLARVARLVPVVPQWCLAVLVRPALAAVPPWLVVLRLP
jgi:hypothetical protein